MRMYTYGKASNGTHVLLPYKMMKLMKSMIVHDSFSVLCDRYGFELMKSALYFTKAQCKA